VSRVLIFGLANRHRGEVHGLCSRSWMVDGSRSVSGGGSTELKVSVEAADNPYLQLGRMVLVDHPKLAPWAGMIDTPWTALPPVGVTLYNASYLFKIRSPETPVKLTGTVYEIVSQVVEIMNDQEETYLRMGSPTRETRDREETFDQRPFWDQLVALLKRSGMEMIVRPELRERQLFLVVDVKRRIGHDTGFLLHDGENPNLVIRGARVNGQIWNRITGIGTQRTERISTEPQLDEESIRQYRTRSRTEQSQARSVEQLEDNVETVLERDRQPWLTLDAVALDVGDTFENLRPGNGVIVHASRPVLPGGVRGWRGQARIMAMQHVEESNEVAMTLEAAL
jgi:hypothetical protein